MAVLVGGVEEEAVWGGEEGGGEGESLHGGSIGGILEWCGASLCLAALVAGRLNLAVLDEDGQCGIDV